MEACRLNAWGCRLNAWGCRLNTRGCSLDAWGCSLDAWGCRLGAWAAAERRGGAHRPRRVFGRGEDEHGEAGRGDEHKAAAEALHVRLVA